ncbi:flagellar biosynthesis protein FlhF [Paenibacillus sp. GCM10027626]|uniref:flagellar biosynthesis protein FlhF n=1 Tax=Paenibacillus sp. GCM10027626 TaxID=3273411 RepID=UPI003624AD04
MKVKRYVVSALPEAMTMIRSELGGDAIILNTKEIKVGGFLGFFGKKRMEVIAAVEAGVGSGSTSSAAAVKMRPARPAAKPAAAQASAVKPAAAPSAVPMLPAAPQLVPAVPQAAAAAAFAATLSQALAEEPTPASASPSPAISRSHLHETLQQKPSESDAVLAELKDMKKWMERISKERQEERRAPAVRALQARLAEQEVADEISERLIAAVEEQLAELAPEAVDRNAVWRLAGQFIKQWLEEVRCGGIDRTTRVVYFVGPTGVGKTTSIAKLAAGQSLQEGRSVGFITADTYRIAAVDQLRTYATILNLPLEVVFSPAEVARAFTQLADRDLIFMDTAGRNFRNELYVSEVNSLMQTNEQAETFLVLSLTGKFKDMAVVAEHFAKYGVNKALYTKQDETSAYGAIMNLALQQGIKPAYIAHGQTVPDDIGTFSPDNYVELLLGAIDQ